MTAGSAGSAADLRRQATQWWKGRAPRERRGLLAAGAVLLGFLAWVVLVQPAWRTMRDAPAQLDRLDTELQRMQRLAAEASSLRGAAPVSAAQAGVALQSATARLGSSAKLVIQGDRGTLTLNGVSPEALRAWLIEARSAGRARPIEVQLNRASSNYNGSLIVSLEAAP